MVIAAITLGNTGHPKRAVNASRERGTVNDAVLGHFASLGWNPIGLTGDDNWHVDKRVAKGVLGPAAAATVSADAVPEPLVAPQH